MTKCSMTPNYKKCQNEATHMIVPSMFSHGIGATEVAVCDECMKFWSPRFPANQIARIGGAK